MDSERSHPLITDDRPVVVGTTAVLDGATASKVADALEVIRRAWRKQGRDLDERLDEAAEVLRLAGDRWESEERRRFRNRNLRTSQMDEELIMGDMATSQVADRLGISHRAVTKQAPVLGGRKVGHRWLFDGTTVALVAREREERCNG